MITDAHTHAVAADLRHVWHPYTQHRGMPTPLEVTRAQGAYLYVRDGRRLFDAISSWWVTLHGHARPEMAEAVSRQIHTLDQVIFTTFTHEPAALLAEELASVLPTGLSRVFFSDDGSTAVEAAVKMALQHHTNRGSPRRIVTAFDNAYHGDTFGAMSVSGRGIFTAPFGPYLFEVYRLPDPSEEDALAALDTLVERHGDDLAAVLVEPLLLGSGGMRVYGENVLRGVAERTRSCGALFIADEVLTGFGRTGPLFACQRAGISPDVICLSKGLTGGVLPLGVTATTDAVFDGFLSEDRHRTLFHGHSFTANPVACAAARASLALLDDASAAARERIHRAHARSLARLSSHPLVTRPRVLGTIAAFDLAAGGGYLHPVGRELADFALAHDVLLRPLGSVVYVLPPYCTTDDDLDHLYSVLEEFLATR